MESSSAPTVPHHLWIWCSQMMQGWRITNKYCRGEEQTSGRSSGTKTTPLKQENHETPFFSPISPQWFDTNKVYMSTMKKCKPECRSWWASKAFFNLSSALKARIVHRPWRDEVRWEKTGLRAAGKDKKRFQWERKAGFNNQDIFTWAESLPILVDSRRLTSRDVWR